MSVGELDALMNRLIRDIAIMLEPEGFARRQKTLRAKTGGNAALINFQKSDQSSDQRLVFTINLAVVCGALLDVERSGVDRADIADSHLRIRLGMLFEEPSDKWWEITRSTDLNSVSADLIQSILKAALPYLRTYLRTDALIDLWRSGKSPGLTATQRSRFLAELEGKTLKGVSA